MQGFFQIQDLIFGKDPTATDANRINPASRVRVLGKVLQQPVWVVRPFYWGVLAENFMNAGRMNVRASVDDERPYGTVRAGGGSFPSGFIAGGGEPVRHRHIGQSPGRKVKRR